MDETYKIWVAIIGLLLLGAIGYKLWEGFKRAVGTAVEEQFKSVSGAIEGITDKLRIIDKETCKNFLVRCIADIERGDSLSETEMQRFKEQYDHYREDLHQNTYLKDKVEKLKAEGKL